jgi:hypothetical protein
MSEARQNLPVGEAELDSLVVDAQQAHLVTDLLAPLVKDTETNDRLDLTLVTLTDADAAVRLLRDREADLPAALDPTWSTLDELLCRLRSIFRSTYGWVPSLGKNRIMSGIQFVTYPFAEAVGGPQPSSGAVAQEQRRQARPGAGAGVWVGLPDTALYQQADLAGRFIAAREALLPTTPPEQGWMYYDGHSAVVADLVLTQAPAAQLDIRPVVEPQAPAAAAATVWKVAAGLIGFLDAGVQIVNCSWVCFTRDNVAPLVLERAVGVLTPTVLVVAAAGNHGLAVPAGPDPRQPWPYSPAWPAALPQVVAVGALDGLVPAEFNPVSIDGRSLAPWVDVLAPGIDVEAAYFGGPDRAELVRVPRFPLTVPPTYEGKLFTGAARWSGTSFAAATVTGAIAARTSPGRSASAALTALLDEPNSPVQPAGQRPMPG